MRHYILCPWDSSILKKELHQFCVYFWTSVLPVHLPGVKYSCCSVSNLYSWWFLCSYNTCILCVEKIKMLLALQKHWPRDWTLLPFLFLTGFVILSNPTRRYHCHKFFVGQSYVCIYYLLTLLNYIEFLVRYAYGFIQWYQNSLLKWSVYISTWFSVDFC